MEDTINTTPMPLARFEPRLIIIGSLTNHESSQLATMEALILLINSWRAFVTREFAE
jgi:hypothetical protein